MKLINNIKNRISKILWYIVVILFSLSIYKIYSYYDYKKYVAEYIKDLNFYYELKTLQEDSKEYAQEINMKIKEYYFMPIEGKFIAIGEGGYFNGKKVYGIYLKFYTYNGSKSYKYKYENNEDTYIADRKIFKDLKQGFLIYKLNDNKLEELYRKVEKKSDMI